MHLVITSKSADKQFFMFFMYSFFFCIVLALHATSADILYAAAVTVTPYIACKFCLPSKNNEGDVNPRQFFIDPKSFFPTKPSTPRNMSIIPCHYFFFQCAHS